MLKQTEMGYELKLGIKGLNVSGKVGGVSTTVSNAAYFGELNVNLDVNNISIKEVAMSPLKELKPTAKGEFYLLLKTQEAKPGVSVSLTEKKVINLYIIKFTQYADESIKVAFGARISLKGEFSVSEGYEGKLKFRKQSKLDRVGALPHMK